MHGLGRGTHRREAPGYLDRIGTPPLPPRSLSCVVAARDRPSDRGGHPLPAGARLWSVSGASASPRYRAIQTGVFSAVPSAHLILTGDGGRHGNRAFPGPATI